MSAAGYTLFETPIGCCGMAWHAATVVGVQLPERTAAATRDRMVERFPELTERTPGGAAKRAYDAIIALLEGHSRDLSSIKLDLRTTTPFRQRVYSVTRRIPRGEVLTYGEVARRLKAPQAARAVGQALGANPFPIIVPCHRVLAAGGKAGGFSATGGVTTKMHLLGIEGALEADRHGFAYDPPAAVAYLCAADKKLARVIAAVGPPKMELKHTSSVFAALAESIVYQQLSGKAAATIFGRVCALFPRGRRDLNPSKLLCVNEANLRGAGLSNNKMLALRDLAERSLAGEVPSLGKLKSMPDEEIVDTLVRVRGIGRWTVEMMLMFRLGRGDVLAVDDLGLRQGHAIVIGRKGETDRKALAAYGERWRPYRSVASWYLWRAVDLARSKGAR